MFCQPRLVDQGLEARMIESLRYKRDVAAQALKELRFAALSASESSPDPRERAIARAYADAALAAMGDVSNDAINDLLAADEPDQYEP
jgi:hypothetical protein